MCILTIMKTFKIALVSTVCFFISTFCFAQDAEFILTKVSQKNISTGNYQQINKITLSSGTRTLKSEGTYLFCTDGVALFAQKPYKSTTIICRDFVKQISSTGKVTTLGSDETFKSISTIFMSVLASDTEMIQENFEQDFSTNGNKWFISLKPKNSQISQALKSFDLFGTFTEEDADLAGYTMKQTNNSEITFNFSQVHYQDALTEEQKTLFN